MNSKIKFYQPNETNENFPDFCLWLKKEKCIKDTNKKEILSLNWEDVEEPTIIIEDENDLAEWAFENLSINPNINFKSTINKINNVENQIFCLGAETVNIIRHSKGVTLKFYETTAYLEKDLLEVSLVEILNYNNEKTLIQELEIA